MGKELRLEPEFVNKKLRQFWDMPSVMPIQLKADADQEFFNELDWQYITEEEKAHTLKQIESIKVRKLEYDKPICLIYNPNSGS